MQQNYKTQQKNVSSTQAVATGNYVETAIKGVLNYQEVDETLNSTRNYGLTQYNPNFKPDMFLDDVLIEIKYSQEGNLYEHNISQMAAYRDYYKPKSVKLLLVDLKGPTFNARLFRVDTLIKQFLHNHKGRKETKDIIRVPAWDMPAQTEEDIIIAEKINAYWENSHIKKPTPEESKELRDGLARIN